MPIADMSAHDAQFTVADFRQLLDERHPFAAILNVEVLEIGYGSATLRLPPNPSYQRLGGTVAGPMLMGLADLALYAAVLGATGNPDAVTASLTINFLRKAPAGGILAHARLMKTGRLAAGEVLMVPDHEESPVAQAISTWAVLAKKA